MALPKNRQAVQQLLQELEPHVLGREGEGLSCLCGAAHCSAPVAEGIEPAGDRYPGQETVWALWKVRMKAHSNGSPWSCGLSYFVEAGELRAMFKRYFGDQDDRERPYNLAVDGADRVHSNLPAAVRIQENDKQIRFAFSWGREQSTAKQLIELGSRLLVGGEVYARVVALLETIQPEVYRGGPDPELPYESTWLLDYDAALVRAAAVASRIFFENGGVTTDHRGTVVTGIDIVFVKHEVK